MVKFMHSIEIRL